MNAPSKFPAQLARASLVVAGIVGFLLLRGREHETTSTKFPSAETASPPTTSSGTSAPGPAGPPVVDATLVPDDAWLVLSLDSTLFPASPFEGEPECAAVPPPPRLEFAVLPPKPGKEDVSFFLAAERVSPAFSLCAERMILRNGGRALEPLGALRRLRTPSGVFAHTEQALAFSTEDGDGETVVAALGSRSSNVLFERHPALAERDARLLVLSVAPEPGWLDGAARSLGAEPGASPLSALRRLTFSVDRGGEGAGLLECVPGRCEELARFAVRSVSDLIAVLPPALGPRLKNSIAIRFPVDGRPDAVGLSLDRAGLSLVQALLRYAVSSGDGPRRPPGSPPEPRKP